jgi:hypothetical protein
VHKYILEQVEPTSDGSTAAAGVEDRPTQEQIKERGLGDYALRRGKDGSLIKSFTVYLNRNNNLAITSHTPDGLNGISTVNLNRMVKAYAVICKNWPAKQADLRKITSELERRSALLDSVQVSS